MHVVGERPTESTCVEIPERNKKLYESAAGYAGKISEELRKLKRKIPAANYGVEETTSRVNIYEKLVV